MFVGNKILTIIVPVYNIEKYLKQCLDSFLAVKMQHEIEILIVDDGSIDSSYEIAKEYAEKYSHMYRIIRKENAGHGSALNVGIKHAAGRYVKTVDGDDWVTEDGINKLLEVLQTTNADVIVTNYKWYDMHSKKTVIPEKDVITNVEFGKVYHVDDIKDSMFVKMHSITIKTELLRQIPFAIDEHCYYVDSEYVLFPMAFVNTMVFYDAFVYIYRIGRKNQSVNIKQMAKNKDQHIRVLKRLLEFYNWAVEKPITEGQRLYIEHGIALIWKSQFKVFLSCKYSKEMLNEVKYWDQFVREEYPEIAKQLKSKSVKAIRLWGYRLYRPTSAMFGLLYSIFYR